MADLKISELTNLTAADPANDMIPIVDVSATPPASGSTKRISINNILACSPTATLASATISGDLTVDTSTLKVDSANNRVGIGTATPQQTFEVVGGTAGINTIFNTGSAGDTRFELRNNNVRSGYVYWDTSEVRLFADTSRALTFYQNGTLGMTLNSTGLGVGGSPTRKLSIVGSGATYANINSGDNTSLVGILLGGTSTPSAGQVIYDNTANSLALFTSGATRLTIDTSGNVGIGVTPSAIANVIRLEIGGALSTNLTLRSTSANASARNWMVGANVNAFGDFVIRQGNSQGAEPNSGTDRLVLDASGNLLVGLTNTTGANYASKFFLSADSGTTKWCVGPYAIATNFIIAAAASGGVYLNGTAATSWTSASDERLKDIIEPISNAIAKVGSLRAVIGKFKFDENNTRKPFLIAQDVQSVLPEAVDASNPEKLGVAYTEVIPLLVAAIKELTAEVNALKNA